MNKNLERELNWLYDLAYNVVGDANREDTDNAYKTIKESLERLEKLENVVEILKGTSIIVVDKNFMTINTNGIWRNDNSGSYDVLKEVFGE